MIFSYYDQYILKFSNDFLSACSTESGSSFFKNPDPDQNTWNTQNYVSRPTSQPTRTNQTDLLNGFNDKQIDGQGCQPGYCMSRKSGPILYIKLLHKMGQDFLDIQYKHTTYHSIPPAPV